MQMGKTKVKVCGLTREEEAEMLADCRVEFAGMVLFFPKSKRNVTLQQAEKILAALKKYGVSKSVAVTVSPTKEQVEQIMRLGFDYIQIHGTLSDEVHDVLRIPVIRAVNVAGETAEDKESIRRQLESVLADHQAEGFTNYTVFSVWDTYGSSPGAGKTFDWNLLKNIQKTDKLLFLAGGLTPENAAQAVKTVAPDVVDVSSGVEKDVSPCAAFAGKDAEKITKFVENVRL